MAAGCAPSLGSWRGISVPCPATLVHRASMKSKSLVSVALGDGRPPSCRRAHQGQGPGTRALWGLGEPRGLAQAESGPRQGSDTCVSATDTHREHTDAPSLRTGDPGVRGGGLPTGTRLRPPPGPSTIARVRRGLQDPVVLRSRLPPQACRDKSEPAVPWPSPCGSPGGLLSPRPFLPGLGTRDPLSGISSVGRGLLHTRGHVLEPMLGTGLRTQAWHGAGLFGVPGPQEARVRTRCPTPDGLSRGQLLASARPTVSACVPKALGQPGPRDCRISRSVSCR